MNVELLISLGVFFGGLPVAVRDALSWKEVRELWKISMYKSSMCNTVNDLSTTNMKKTTVSSERQTQEEDSMPASRLG